MIDNWGLLFLGIIQIGTGLLIFSKKNDFFGVAALPSSLSHYRYMLTSLWVSVGFVYAVGAFANVIEPGAVLLAIVNVILEVAGYWMAARSGIMPKSYAALSTLIMGTAGLLSILLYLR